MHGNYSTHLVPRPLVVQGASRVPDEPSQPARSVSINLLLTMASLVLAIMALISAEETNNVIAANRALTSRMAEVLDTALATVEASKVALDTTAVAASKSASRTLKLALAFRDEAAAAQRVRERQNEISMSPVVQIELRGRTNPKSTFGRVIAIANPGEVPVCEIQISCVLTDGIVGGSIVIDSLKTRGFVSSGSAPLEPNEATQASCRGDHLLTGDTLRLHLEEIDLTMEAEFKSCDNERSGSISRRWSLQRDDEGVMEWRPRTREESEVKRLRRLRRSSNPN